MQRRSLFHRNVISLPALPTPTDDYRGAIVEVGGIAYWCTGTTWVDMLASRVVHQVVAGTVGRFSGTSTIPVATTPTSTMGTQVWSRAVTVKRGQRILLENQIFGDYSVNSRYITVAYFRDTSLIGVAPFNIAATGIINGTSFMDYDTGLVPGNTYTYSCRVGGSGTGTWYVNQNKNGDRYGGGFANTFTLTETD